jgi:hypothetical protein
MRGEPGLRPNFRPFAFAPTISIICSRRRDYAILDALAGPEAETPADQQRARDREQIEKAFPAIDEEPAGIVKSGDETRA